MRPATRTWSVCANIYRALVVVQTVAWAVESLIRISMRHAAASRSTPPMGVGLAMASIIGVAAGVLAYYGCRTRWPVRIAVLCAWPWFQAAGVVVLVAYAVTGAMRYFLFGMLTLAIMHIFSPNRFEPARQMPRA